MRYSLFVLKVPLNTNEPTTPNKPRFQTMLNPGFQFWKMYILPRLLGLQKPGLEKLLVTTEVIYGFSVLC